MNKQDFMRGIQKLVEFLTSETTEVKRIDKVGVSYTGLTLAAGAGRKSAGIFNLDMAYDDYVSGRKTFDELVEQAVMSVKEQIDDNTIGILNDYGTALRHMFVRLNSRDKVKGDVPYKPVAEDLAMTAHVLLSEDNGSMMIAGVANGLLEQWQVTEDELFEDALAMSGSVMPPVIRTMGSFFGDEESDVPAIVVTNEKTVNGAAAILYPGVCSRVQEMLGAEEFYILPSSIHEVICVPKDGNADSLLNTIRHANKTVVLEKDILSDNLYDYDGKEIRRANS